MPEASWATSAATRKAMQANRSRDTKPELRLRKALHAMGLRYRVCTRPLPDVRRTVDIVFRKAKVAVEVRGCFWHGCPQHYRAPSSNGGYWSEKVQRNRRRDADTAARLAEAGWTLTVVWEHDDLDVAAEAIAEQVKR
jgi:DNA mismatch endonuclease (patch repair protein)